METEKKAEEREEGEIVENIEYEDISSDEEFSLRQRIEELEERNFELEQIANIQGFATNPYDLSTGRSERVGKENLRQRKRRRSKTVQGLQTPKASVRRNKSANVHPIVRRRQVQKAVRIRKRKKRAPSESSSSDSDCLLNRQELKLALNRTVNQSDDDVVEIPIQIPVITIDDDEEEDVDVLKLRLEALQSKQEVREELQPPPPLEKIHLEETDEQQLRLIALKSAIVKKHEARKKRKEQEQRPYSPTDALELVVVMSPPPDPKADTMEISPVDSPATIPTNCVNADMEMSSDIPAENTPSPDTAKHEESDDEMTLRKLLLAKIENKHLKLPEDVREKTPDSLAEVSLEEDCLRSLLLSTMKKTKSPTLTAEDSIPLKIPLIPPTTTLIPPIISDSASVRPQIVKKAPKRPQFSGNLILIPTTTNPSVLKSPKKSSMPKKMLKNPAASKVKSKMPEKPLPDKDHAIVNPTNSLPQHVPSNKTDVLVEKRSSIITDLPVIKVPPLVITLRLSDVESDDYSGGEIDGKNYDVDNKSPLSLIMESPCNSPASPHVSAQPEESTTVAPTKVFQQKLDEFLMQARKTAEEQTIKEPPPKKTIQLKNPKTPLALSHLPISSQLEYRRLVARMNQLERQKKHQMEQKILPPPAKKPKISTTETTDKSVLKTSNNIKVVLQNDIDGQQKEVTTAERTVMVRKEDPLRKKVLMKTVTAASSAALVNGGEKDEMMASAVKQLKKKAQAVQKKQERQKTEEELMENFFKKISTFSEEKKSEALKIYENHFSKTSTTFLNGLDNLLIMVKRVQSEKLEQYRLQDELMRLKQQVKLVEDTLMQQKRVVQNLTPKMTQQHKNILKHRNKCVTLNKMCVELGQMVKGKMYRPPGDTKQKLMEKFKDLAVETKRLKEIQVIDGTKALEVPSPKAAEEKEEAQVPDNTDVDMECQASSSSQCPPGGNTQNSYKSPLDHMNSEQNPNPDAIVCPFDLMGKCEDVECHFSHLSDAQKAR
ncbi:hypothetical protein DMENIID0001_153280 [Sergentomyia squamirostris]